MRKNPTLEIESDKEAPSAVANALACMFGIIALIILCTGIVLVVCAVSLELTKKTFNGLLFGGIGCILGSVYLCCRICFW